MSITLEPGTIELEEIAIDDSIDEFKSIHLWYRDDYAICGSTKINHNCFEGIARAVSRGETECFYCHKPYCQYCLMLLGWI